MNENSAVPLPQPADEDDRRVLDDIARYGWHVIGVEADDEGPAFAYSVGMLHTLGHPEVILFGLDIKAMCGIINAIGEGAREGADHRDWHQDAEVLEGHSVCYRSVDESHYEE